LFRKNAFMADSIQKERQVEIMSIFKRVVCVLLAAVMLLFAAGCSEKQNGKIDIDTLAKQELANFPEPTEAFAYVLGKSDMDKDMVDDYLSRLVAAYNAMDAEEFCEYAQKQNSEVLNEFIALNKDITEAVSQMPLEEIGMSVEVSQFAFKLAAADAKLAAWNVKYLKNKININSSSVSYDDMKKEMGEIINEYSSVFYGEEFVTV